MRRLQRELKKYSHHAAALVTSCPPAIKSRDVTYPYRQNSSLYYLTGIRSTFFSLILYADARPVRMIVEKQSPHLESWLGPQKSLSEMAEAIGAEVLETSDPLATSIKSVEEVDHLFFDNTAGSLSLQVVQSLLAIPQSQRRSQLVHFSYLEFLLEGMRVIKDKSELAVMKKAIKVAEDSFLALIPQLRLGMAESTVRGLLLGEIYSRGGAYSFNPIIGSGAGSAFPHYSGEKGILSAKDLLLIDWGAEFEQYQSDMTRVLPLGGRFDSRQRKLYEIVLEAQKVAIASIKPGVKLTHVNAEAVKVITEGLVEFGILQGNVSELVEKKAYVPFFRQDGVSHPIGLDVQEVGARRSRVIETLKEGMVITVEPGLYFSGKRPKGLSKCGVRIEDMVEVTKNGARVLTSALPKEVDAIEALMV
jgi:Xaa-Pro aminopeptidase